MNKNIGVCLSGGGIRASIFHLGVLKWMAENNMLEDVRNISTVSGASLCIGLIYSNNNYKWPTSKEFLENVLPKIKKIILDKDIQKAAILRLIINPWNMSRKVNVMADVIKKYWGVTGKLSDLEKEPSWYINCTTFESGKRFRFSQDSMGDYKIGYVNNPDISIADAIASSAGFPILIGPYKLKLSDYNWKRAKGEEVKGRYIHLWDGGVYDNLGLESVYKMDEGGHLTSDLDYIIISNASASIAYEQRGKFFGKKLKRLLDISMDQVGALRTRSVVDYITRNNNGMYIKIGNSCEEICEDSNVNNNKKEKLIRECISKEDAKKVRNYQTTLAKPSEEDFELILRHGYEVCKCIDVCYDKEEGLV